MPKHEKTHEKPVKKAKDKQQDLQEKYIELQLLKQQIAAYVEQKQAIDERESELGNTIEALKKLSTVKAGEEMWSSIGSATFIRSDIKDIEKVLVAAGAGVVIKESVPRAIEILQSRLDDLTSISNQIVEQANALLARITKLEPEVEKLAGQSG